MNVKRSWTLGGSTARSYVPGNGERVPTHEQLNIIIKAGHRVPAADPDKPGVGLDPHDRRLERPAWLGIPGSVKRRVERQPQALDADRGYPHRQLPP